MKLPVFIGLRYTGTRARTQLVAFLSRVSILGLIVGVGLLLAVLSIMNGFDKELREKILSLVPQAAIYKHKGIENWPEMQAQLEQQAKIEAAVPFVQLNGLASKKALAEPVAIFGIDVEQELRVSRLLEFVPLKSLAQIKQHEDTVLMGAGIAKKLEVAAGSSVLLLIPSAKGGAPQAQYFNVVEVIETQTELDHSLVLVNLKAAAKLSGMPNAVSGLRLKLTDLFEARDVVWQNLLKLGGGYYGSSWMNTHGNLYHAIHLSKKLVALLMLLMVAIAAFNVVSTLIVVVVEKEADIAILRTQGASTKTIMAIFMVQGTAIGILGTSIGVAFGVSLSFILGPLVAAIESLFGAQFLNSDVYPLTYLPTEVLVGDVIFVASIALVMSFLATLYPAWRASKIQPAEALRYE